MEVTELLAALPQHVTPWSPKSQPLEPPPVNHGMEEGTVEAATNVPDPNTAQVVTEVHHPPEPTFRRTVAAGVEPRATLTHGSVDAAAATIDTDHHAEHCILKSCAGEKLVSDMWSRVKVEPLGSNNGEMAAARQQISPPPHADAATVDAHLRRTDSDTHTEVSAGRTSEGYIPGGSAGARGGSSGSGGGAQDVVAGGRMDSMDVLLAAMAAMAALPMVRGSGSPAGRMRVGCGSDVGRGPGGEVAVLIAGIRRASPLSRTLMTVLSV